MMAKILEILGDSCLFFGIQEYAELLSKATFFFRSLAHSCMVMLMKLACCLVSVGTVMDIPYILIHGKK